MYIKMSQISNYKPIKTHLINRYNPENKNNFCY